MLSTGNDIVSLDLINKERSNDSRFYKKIITEAEERMYRESLLLHLPFESFVWLCWSIKESTYKFIKRSDQGYLFSPVKISVNQINIPSIQSLPVFDNKYREEDVFVNEEHTGTVTAAGQTLYFRSKIFQNAIATIVSETDSFQNILWGIRSIGSLNTEEQSKEVRAFALQKLQELFPEKTISIPKSSGSYPVVMEGSNQLAFPLSFAHHGNFVSYSLNLTS